ncbi:MAG: NADH-quinone oxidoreductase subunit NuoB [Lentisphaerae bacterium]|nr:NADH-quinone oxidoreductase subunit NuoB [Lentisphaerota bacterium]
MIKALCARLFQKYRTNKFPDAPPNLPEHFRGRIEFDRNDFTDEIWQQTAANCPVDAMDKEKVCIDLGRCIFCGKCQQINPAIRFTSEYRMGTMQRENLLTYGHSIQLDEQLDAGIKALYGKSLHIRQVSAGGCAACELDFNVLNTLAWDMGRFGIKVVASPRHADALLITGPVTDNMRTALLKTYAAMGEPKLVIACGACAISGGIYYDSPHAAGGVEGILPVHLYVPGCPPHPATLLEALVRFMGRRQLDNRA